MDIQKTILDYVTRKNKENKYGLEFYQLDTIADLYYLEIAERGLSYLTHEEPELFDDELLKNVVNMYKEAEEDAKKNYPDVLLPDLDYSDEDLQLDTAMQRALNNNYGHDLYEGYDDYGLDEIDFNPDIIENPDDPSIVR